MPGKNTEQSEETKFSYGLFLVSIIPKKKLLPTTNDHKLTTNMYIYNVTINIDEAVHNEWLTWMESHILDVLNTGRFLSAKLTEVLVEEEMGGKTYSIQYTANTREDLDDYYANEAEKLRGESRKKFSDKMLTFRTELKLIKEFYPTNTSN